MRNEPPRYTVFGFGLMIISASYSFGAEPAEQSSNTPSPVSPAVIADAQMIQVGGHGLHLYASYHNAKVSDNGDGRDISYDFIIANYSGQTLVKVQDHPVYLGMRYHDQKVEVDVDITSKLINYPLSKSMSEHLTQEITPIVAWAYTEHVNFALALEFKNYVDRQSVRRAFSSVDEDLNTYKESTLRLNPSLNYVEKNSQVSLSYRPYVQKKGPDGNAREPQLIDAAYQLTSSGGKYHLALQHKGWKEMRDSDDDKTEILVGYEQALNHQKSLAAFFMYQPSYARSDGDTHWSNMAVARLTILYQAPFEDGGSFSILVYREQGSAWSEETLQLTTGADTKIKNTYDLVSHAIKLSISQKF